MVSGSVEAGLARDEANLDALIQDGGDPLEHGQRMPLIVRILQPADDRIGGADQVGQGPLTEAGGLPQGIYLAGDFRVGPLFLEGGLAFRPVGIVIRDDAALVTLLSCPSCGPRCDRPVPSCLFIRDVVPCLRIWFTCMTPQTWEDRASGFMRVPDFRRRRHLAGLRRGFDRQALRFAAVVAGLADAAALGQFLATLRAPV